MIGTNQLDGITLDPTEEYIIRVFRMSTRTEQHRIFETAMDVSLRRQGFQPAAQPKPKEKLIAFPVQH